MNINDRDLLAKTLMAEAGNQGFGGMLAAGSVIMNRAGGSGYGDGIRNVILKPGQFSAWNSLTGYAGGEQGQDMAAMRPSAEAYQAADKLLAGDYQDPTGGATHYYNPAISNPKWGRDRAGGNWKQIGDHIFGFADANRKPNPNQAVADDTMQALGVQPQGILAPTQTSETESKPMMNQQKPRGLLEGIGIQKMEEGAEGETGQRFYQRDSFKDTAAVLAQGFGRMGIMGMEEIADGIAKQRTESKAKNKTIEMLRKMPNGEELVKLAEVMGPKAVASHLMKQQLGGGDANVQSSQTLRDQSGVIMTMRDGSIAVKTIGGETLTGQAALDFAKTSNETYTEQQRETYRGRRKGTLEADVDLGAAAEAAKKSGGLTMERGFEAYDNAVKAGSALTTMDSAIAAIDDGAKSGVIYNMMPNVTEASAALGTAMNQMGLDVISSVTFGALSEGEMNLAMETAVPRNLGPEELRSYLVEKRDAQAKAREALMAAARYLTQPGNTISGWLDQQAQSDPPPSAISPQGRTYNPETGKFE